MATCLSCGNNINSTKAGSLTQFVLGKSECNCKKAAGKAKAKIEIAYCSRCSKKIQNKSQASLTAFLQNQNYCKCKRTVIVQKTSLQLKASQLTKGNKQAEQAVMQAQLEQELETAKTLANTYKLVDSLGEGGMSFVYLAEHTRLHRLVALKIMKADLGFENNEALFREEARKLVQLSHQSLVKVLDFSLHNGKWPLIAMELINGETLAERLERLGPMEVEEALLIFKKVAEGLSYIHLKGLVHKDLKPGNIMLASVSEGESEAEVKILDFGISQFNQYGALSSPNKATTVIGSPCYMSPEEWLSGSITPRTDLYSLGCSLYEALTGHAPYEAETVEQIKEQHINAPYQGLTTNAINPQYSIELELLLKNLLAKNPEERPNSAQAVINTLAELLTKKQSQASKSGSAKKSISKKQILITAGAALCALAIAAVGSSYYLKQQQEKEIAKSQELRRAASDNEQFGGLGLIKGVANSMSKGDKDVAALPQMIIANPIEKIGVETKVLPLKISKIGNTYNLSIPPGVDLGGLQIINGSITTTRLLNAEVIFEGNSGKLFWAFDNESYFLPEKMFSYVDTMGKLPLYGMRFVADKNNKVSEAIFRLKDLKSLEIKCREKTPCAVPDALQTLKNLQFLTVTRRDLASDSPLPNEAIANSKDAEKLAALPYLPNLKYLQIGNLGDPNKLLTKLADSKKLTILMIDDSKLSSENVQQITKLKALKWLLIRRTKLDYHSTNTLMQMNNLEYIDLSGNYMTATVFENIPANSALKCVFVSREKIGLSPSKFTNLKEQLAKRKIQLRDTAETWTARGFWDDPFAAYRLPATAR